MTLVAIAFDGAQWNQMFDESLDDAAVLSNCSRCIKEGERTNQGIVHQILQ
jgi:hypothetical protein